MPQADGSIIIDTRINNKGAEADLKLLQAKVKSTAQQISALEKSYTSAFQKRSVLGESLKQARADAAATARELSRLNTALDAQRGAGLTPAAEDIKRSDRLAATLDKQKAKIQEMSREYRQQKKLLDTIQAQHTALTARLEQEQAAAQKASSAYGGKKDKGSAAKQITTASTAMEKFGRRLSGIVSGALLFNVISSGLSSLVGWMGSALQSTDAFGQALRNLQGAASVAAAPLMDALGGALAYVVNLLATGISYLARFISMLTGKSLSAMKSSAKAMNSYGAAAGSAAKETEKATRSLAGFDEITRLDAPQEDASGGGAGGSSGPNYDFVDQTGAGFSSLLDAVKGFWDQFTASLAPSIAAWSAAWEQIKTTAMAVWPQIQAAASGLWTNALQPLLDYLTGTWAPGIVNAFSQAFAPIVGDLVSTGIRALADLFVWACGIITDAVNNLLIPLLDMVSRIWQDMMAGISDAWNQYGQPLMDGVLELIRSVETVLSNLYYTVVEPILSNLIALLQKLWDEHLKPLWDDVVALVLSIGNYILSGWNNVLLPLINWLISTFGPAFTEVFNAAASAVETAAGFIADAIDLALYVFRGILDFLTAVFQGDWQKAWDVVKDTVLGVWDRITGGVKDAINGIIGFVNGMISAVVNGLNRVGSALNSLSFTVPDWVPGIGGSTLGFNFGTITAPQIPYLAQGAVIPPNREFMAVLGDQSHGTNVEAPLATIQQAVADVMQDNLDGELAALEAIRGTLLDILQAVYGIDISDTKIGKAANRYTTRQAIITGRA